MTSGSTYVRLTSSGGVLEACGFCISESPLYAVGGYRGELSPLWLSLLLEAFGYTGDTPAGDKATAGTYIPPAGTDEYTKLFLKCAQKPVHVSDPTIS